MGRVRIQEMRRELLTVYKADFEMELSPITLVFAPDTIPLSKLIYSTLRGKCAMYTTEYLTVAADSCIKAERKGEIDGLIKDEFKKFEEIAKEMKLASEVYTPAYETPIIRALRIAFGQDPGEYYLVAVHPEMGVDPVGAFALGHVVAVAVRRLWNMGIRLYLIAITNNMEFVRGAITKRTAVYIVKRKQINLDEYLYVAERWNKFDIIPPFFDSAALALKRGIID